MEVNGWRLFVHPLFQRQLDDLTRRAEKLAAAQPKAYRSHPVTKRLATIRRYMLEIIPRDPNAPEFRLGNTLGPDNRHWFRAKFHQRFRLFFRFSSRQRVIIYVWINDESTLRKAGSKTHPHARFRAMLESGEPPNSLDDLLKPSKPK